VATNVADQRAEKIVENYKTLWIVEDAFGEIKGSLRSRPVFHWEDERIVGFDSAWCYLNSLS
jgi:transposase